MSELSNADKLLLRLDYTLAKQAVAEYRQAQTERSDPAADPRAEQFEVEDRKARKEEAKENPTEERFVLRFMN